MSVASDAPRRPAVMTLLNRPTRGPHREVEMLTGQIPVPPRPVLGILLGVALLGAASALVALLVVVVTLRK